MVELADEAGSHTALREGVEKLLAVLEATPEATVFLANRTVPVATRRALLDKLLAELHVDVHLGNLVRLLLDRGRIDDLAAIAARLAELLDARSGIVKAEVVTAQPLSPDAFDRLRGTLGRRLGSEIELTATVDDGLIGGLRVQVGQLIFDASVRNHLDRLRERLAASHVA